MKKGFTLIELLAVIVILAIIALIATPIIINIIENAREESEKRSVELYASAVKNAIASYQLTHKDAPTSIDDLTIDYDGDVECTTREIYEDGNIYLADCTVNGSKVEDYTYGTSQETEEQQPEQTQDTYAYLTYTGSYVDGPSIGGDASSLSTSAPSDKNYYLKFKLDDENKVTNSYACSKFGGQEYCLEGGSEDYYGWDTAEAHSTGNVKVFYDIQSASISGVSCHFDSGYSGCGDGSVYLNAFSNGFVEASGGGVGCFVEVDGISACDSI